MRRLIRVTSLSSSRPAIVLPRARAVALPSLCVLQTRTVTASQITKGISSGVPMQSVGAATQTAKAAQASPFRDVTLNEILANKHAKLSDVTSVNEEDTVFSAIATMERLGIGAVLVKNHENQYTGIFSERDYMRKIALKGLSSRNTPIKNVMTPQPVIVPSSATATSVMELMTKKRFRHVPVRHDASGEVIGIISIGDILATVLREYKEHVSFMTDMIHGRYSA